MCWLQVWRFDQENGAESPIFIFRALVFLKTPGGGVIARAKPPEIREIQKG